MSRPFMLATSFACVLCAIGCSVSPTDDEDGTSADAIHGGTATTDRVSSVGQLVVEPADGRDLTNYCTATLVAPDVVMSAAACMYFSGGPTVTNGSFFLGATLAARGSAPVTKVSDQAFVGLPTGGLRVRSDYAKVLVLLKLAAPVRGGVPVKLAGLGAAARLPSKGDAVSIYGYGCKDARDDYGVLRSAELKWGATFGSSAGCGAGAKGDFGAPVFDKQGRLVAVLGAIDAGLWALSTGTDDIVTLGPEVATEVGTKLRAWSSP